MAITTQSAEGAVNLRRDQQAMAHRMLIDGATFEDIVITAKLCGWEIPQEAVEEYFRSNPELHALRASRQVEIAREIRKATKEENPEDVQLADAVILTGLQRLTRATAMLDVNDALRRKLERENLFLKQQALRLKVRHENQSEKYYRARTRMLSAQWRAAREKLLKLQEQVSQSRKCKKLSHDIVERIQEIYGLVQAPPVPPVGAPKEDEQGAR